MNVELPEGVDPNNESAVRDFLDYNWEDIPLPSGGEYISGSDELDEYSIRVID